MIPRRYKLVQFLCESLGRPEHAPACEEIELTAVLENELGVRVERTKTILAYSRIMADPEQYPALIVTELRSMMRENELPGEPLPMRPM